MNQKFRPILILIIIALMLFLILALSGFNNTQPTNSMLIKPDTGAALLAKTPTPVRVTSDQSEIGSTDWIMVMGVVIVTIIVIPIFLKRKSWSQD